MRLDSLKIGDWFRIESPGKLYQIEEFDQGKVFVQDGTSVFVFDETIEVVKINGNVRCKACSV